MIEYIITFIACLVAGVLTGVTGLGGGLVIVPVFVLLKDFGYVDFSMYQIIGISATVVFFNSIVTLFYRRKEKFIDLHENIKNGLAVMAGAFLGSYLSYYLSDFFLNVLYLFVAFVSIVLIKKKVDYKIANNVVFRLSLFLLAGALTSAVGVAGAALFASLLSLFYGLSAKRLLPTISLLVVINAIFAFAGKLYAKEIVFAVVPVVVVASFLGAKIGVFASKKISSNAITNTMIVVTFLGAMVVVCEMLQLFNRS